MSLLSSFEQKIAKFNSEIKKRMHQNDPLTQHEQKLVNNSNITNFLINIQQNNRLNSTKKINSNNLQLKNLEEIIKNLKPLRFFNNDRFKHTTC